MTKSRAAGDEQPLYKSADVLITRTRAVIHGFTYQISDVASVRVHHQPVQMAGVAAGLGLFVIGLLYALGGSHLMGGGALTNGALLLAYFLFLKHRFYVQITTAAGQVDAPLVYRKRAQAQRVVDALTHAMSIARE